MGRILFLSVCTSALSRLSTIVYCEGVFQVLYIDLYVKKVGSSYPLLLPDTTKIAD